MKLRRGHRAIHFVCDCETAKTFRYWVGRHHFVEEAALESLRLNGHDLTLADVAAVARRSASPKIDIEPMAAERMRESNGLKQRLIDRELPIYGVTTGFGDSCTSQIPPEKTFELQRNLVRYHVNGTGPIASAEVTRATMLIRANCLARGYSGVRPELVTHLIDCLTHDILPQIPERGSLGASGDLVPLCYVASALMGEGQVLYRGQVQPAEAALAASGLAPIVLQAKEGLGLINGTSYMSAFAALAIESAKELAYLADLCTALASQVLLGNQGHFDPFIHRQKPHPGQLASSTLIRTLLAGSGMSFTQSQVLTSDPMPAGVGYHRLDHSVQDRYSIRCAPAVTGVLRDASSWAEQWVTVEINSSNDNPLFDAESGVVHSGGNFYGGHVGHAMDSLKLALANVGNLLDRQLALIVDEKFNNGLPANLAPRFAPDDWQMGLHHGFKGMQIAASAITAEALKLTTPASAFSRSSEAHNQDVVSMGTIAARDARTAVELIEEVAAIHLLALCQAADLRGADRLSPLTRRAYELVRAHVPTVDRDRHMDGDIGEVTELIRSGELRHKVMTAGAIPEPAKELRYVHA